jgi:hypothetical protein
MARTNPTQPGYIRLLAWGGGAVLVLLPLITFTALWLASSLLFRRSARGAPPVASAG